MLQPIVAVSCDRFKHERLTWSGGPASYLEAAAHVGLLPIQIPTIETPIDLAPILDVVSGVILTGARSNVHPAHYAGGPHEDAEPLDELRDRLTLPLIREAVARALPLLAICRGIQELNVAFGGTLHAKVHDVPGRDNHRSPTQDDLDAWFGMRHDVALRPGGELAKILQRDTVTVNSVHNQGIDKLAPRATIEATAADGQIEAISIQDTPAFALGVQWHPEHFVTTDPPSHAIFEAFAAAARDHARGTKARAA